jgi:uncharacterized protein YcbX
MVLDQIVIYPIKSLDGVVVDEARITSGGILEFDRVYAIVDEAGAYVNGKRTARIQLLRTQFDLKVRELSIWETGASDRSHFSLENPGPFNQWLSDFFGFSVKLVCEEKSGFPDDRTAFGPTITSEASLRTVAGWFPGIDLESARRRFRSNLEIDGVEAFGEDILFGSADELKPFQIGDVHFRGHNPCQRCVVPTRDPDGSDSTANFQKTFMHLRKTHLPSWSNASRFNHYYRFAINTSVPASEAGKSLRVGDAVRLT